MDEEHIEYNILSGVEPRTADDAYRQSDQYLAILTKHLVSLTNYFFQCFSYSVC